MNHSRVHISNHMPHDTHDHQHHHFNAIQEESISSTYNHFDTSDHHSMMKVIEDSILR
jgi:hypothetical protein